MTDIPIAPATSEAIPPRPPPEPPPVLWCVVYHNQNLGWYTTAPYDTPEKAVEMLRYYKRSPDAAARLVRIDMRSTP